jgi:radical SAM enzyme (TIGR01210 family)
MCDLWKNTLESPTPKGAIPAQIRLALAQLPPARHVKLYNAGSFFDKGAVPEEEHEEIASLLAGFERVVVECHPALVGKSCRRFRELLGETELEVAMGLETARPEVLKKLEKGMTVDDFRRAASFLRRNGIALRAFVLVGIPFLRKEEWGPATRASIEVAFTAGAAVVSLIPTRPGNGTLEELQRRGLFEPPTLADLESAVEDFFEGKNGPRPGLLFADLWDANRLGASPCCAAPRVERLRRMNLRQRNLPPFSCPEARRHARGEGETRGESGV